MAAASALCVGGAPGKLAARQPRQEGARQEGARQDGARQDGARQDGARQDGDRLAGNADELIAQFSHRTGIADLSVTIMRGESVLLLRHAGRFDDNTVLSVASASKWMVGATAMALVDAGLLRLDAPISAYVKGLPATYAALPLHQLLSYTAGLPSLATFVEFQQPPDISLAESARLAAREPLASAPGTQFDYGGANLQFIGAAAEQATGKNWQTIFDEYIGRPLGLRNTLWGGLREPPVRASPIANPKLQGGAWTTLSDYAAFLAMIAQQGRYKQRAVLSPSAVSSMGRIMTRDLRKGFMAPGAENSNAEYMIAHWCERSGPQGCVLESSPGFFGTYPWIDHEARLHGIIFVNDRLQRIARDERALRDALIKLYA